MGAWVLINGTWYYSVCIPNSRREALIRKGVSQIHFVLL